MAKRRKINEVTKDIVGQVIRHRSSKCPYKVVCVASGETCIEDVPTAISAFKPPVCFIRRQKKWYEEEWVDLKTTSWVEVLSLQKPLLFVLFIISTVVAFFLATVLIAFG